MLAFFHLDVVYMTDFLLSKESFVSISTGYYPVTSLPIVATYMQQFTQSGDKWKKKEFVGTSGFYYDAELTNLCHNMTNITPKSFSPYHFGPYGVEVTGLPVALIPPLYLYSKVVKVNNKPYKERVKRDEMVVSDFQRFQAYLEFRNGGAFKFEGPPVQQGRTMRHVYSAGVGLQKQFIADEGIGDCFYFSNPRQALDGNFVSWYQKATVSDGVSPFDVGFKTDVFEDFLNSVPFPDDNVLASEVMGVLAEANRASVDLLTAMAELPETVVSALNGCKAVLKIFRDAKKKEFSLLTKEKRLRREHEQRVHRLNFESYQEYLAARNDRTRRIIEAKRVLALKQLRADLKLTLASLADAIAGVWLNFRYNIMPNVYLVEGAIKAHDEFNTLFKRWRTFLVYDVPIPQFPGWRCNETIPIEFRCFIKRRFDAADAMSKFLKEFSGSMFLTAYELIPLSFVLDWFINIGNLLAASLGSNRSGYKEASTISLKIPQTVVTYVHIESGASVNVTFKGYKRSVIDPSDYCQLIWLPDLSPVRYYDAAALSWNIALSKLIHPKKG